MQIRYLHSLEAAIISTRGKEFYISPGKEEWEWLFKLLKREAEIIINAKQTVVIPDSFIPEDTSKLVADFLERGGHIKGRELTLEDLDL